jgi:rRNA maturation protein Rpf1
VYPGSERFNRGSIGLDELAARIHSSGAVAALVVSTSQGNPERIQVIRPNGSEQMQISVDGVRLRREISQSSVRIRAIHSVSTAPDAPPDTTALASLIAELADTELGLSTALSHAGSHGANAIMVRFDPLPGGKTMWSHYHAQDLKEVGPGIRTSSIRWFD